MIKVPNLYLLSTFLIVIALLLIAYTQIHFVIVFMVFGALAYLPNFWVGSQYGLKVTLFVKEFEPELYREYKSNYKYKGVFFISPKAHKSKAVLDKLDKEHQYALKKYAESSRKHKIHFSSACTILAFRKFLYSQLASNPSQNLLPAPAIQKSFPQSPKSRLSLSLPAFPPFFLTCPLFLNLKKQVQIPEQIDPSIPTILPDKSNSKGSVCSGFSFKGGQYPPDW